MEVQGSLVSTPQRGNRETVMKSKLVICEGIEEQLFFPRLLRTLGAQSLNDELQFFNCNGKSKLEPFLQSGLPNIPGFNIASSIGIVIDADNDGYESSLRTAQSALRLAGFPVPSSAAEACSNGTKKSVIWIMPDNNSPGELEDLYLRALGSHRLIPCIQELQECAIAHGHYTTISAKTHLYTLLAWLDPPGKRLAEVNDTFIQSWNLDVFKPILDSFFTLL